MAATASFEDEILALNPEYDLVFGKNNENTRNESPHALEPNIRLSSPNNMKIISRMNEIINAKPIGELPTQHDWEDQQSVETETITLMRKLGLEQSVDRPPDEKRTIATVPTSEDVIFMKNGRKKMSIFMADTYFELKPRSEPSFDLDDDVPAPDESTTSDYSDDVNLYQPIFESTPETETTSLSEDPDEKSNYGVAYKHLNSGVSSDSGKRKPIPAQRRFSNQQTGDRYTRDGSKQRFNDSRSSSSSSSRSRSSRGWPSLNGSFSEVRDENNWRLNVSKPKAPEKNQTLHKNVEQKIPNSKPSDVNEEEYSRPVEASSCGRTLYKPKDLFMKKKAMLIQQVLAEYQS